MTGADACRTEVDLVWWRGSAQTWVRFGLPIDEVLHDRRRRTVSFAPGSTFALVRWAGGDYGTTRSELDILRAVGAGEDYVTRPDVRPGAEVLLALVGWTRVQRALAAIDAVEAEGFAPPAVAPDYWRHLHNRLLAGLTPRRYGRARHRAWLLRRTISS